jgi:hypothetical protein
MKPILLIPVYRGGDLFRECLQSLNGKEGDFELVVISINGSPRERELDKATLRCSDLPRTNVVVLETKVDLSAPLHGAFALRAIKSMGFSAETQIMNLFHDDWLLRGPSNLDLDSSSVLVGDWFTNQSSELFSATQVPLRDVQNWIESGGDGVSFINGSGMIAPLGVRQSAGRIMSVFMTGVRYEYFLLTHKKVRYFQSSQDPLVRIRIHEGQDGLRQNFYSTFRGDLAFVIWLFLQGRIVSWKALSFAIKVLMTSLHSAIIRAGKEMFPPAG